ncbi:MAG TPA: hypothetical protein PKW35_00210 [Nannocystaceae bacterium]|nr:hypothetical protein [Nannocystaceae bacterium]
MDNLTLPFPWSDRAGLAPALADPELWNLALRAQDRAVLKLLVPRPPAHRRLATDTDDTWGPRIVDLLEQPQARARATARFRQMIKKAGRRTTFAITDYLAELLVILVSSRPLPLAGLIVDACSPTIIASDLTVDRFRHHLTHLDPAPASWLIAVLTCAEAMIRPTEAPLFLDALLAHNPAYGELVIGAGPIHSTPSSPAPSPARSTPIRLTTPKSDATKAPPQPAPPAPSDREPGPTAAAASATRPGAEASTHNPPRIDAASTPESSSSPSLTRPIIDALDSLGVEAISALARATGQLPDEATRQRLADLVASLRRLDPTLGAQRPWPQRATSTTLQDYIELLGLLELELIDETEHATKIERALEMLAQRLTSARSAPLTETTDLTAHECLDILVLFATPSVGEHTRQLEALADPLILGGATAIALHAAPEETARRLANVPEEFRAAALRALIVDHLGLLLHTHLAPDATRELFARAIRQGHLDRVRTQVETALRVGELPEPSRALYRAAVAALDDGHPVEALLRAHTAGQKALDGTDRRRAGLLERIDLLPGMTGIYHRLRVTAQTRFLRPLREMIAAGDRARAQETWDATSLGEMIEACLGDLTGNALRNLGDSHVEQTRRYLEAFGDQLRVWSSDAASCDDTALKLIALKWTSAVAHDPRLAAALRRPSERECADKLEDLEQPWYRIDDADLIIDDAAIHPKWPRTWVAAIAGDRPRLTAALAEAVAERLIPDPMTPREAVERMLGSGLFRAANAAHDLVPSTAERVRQATSRRRDEVLAEHRDAWSRARTLAESDQAVKNHVAEIEELLDALDFDQAAYFLGDLDHFCLEQELHRDPRRQHLARFLREAGETVGPREDHTALQRRMDAVRRSNNPRRLHLDALLVSAEDLAEELSTRLKRSAEELDRPNRWPSEDDARRLTETLDTLFTFIRSHRTRYLRYSTVDLARLERELVNEVELAITDLPDLSSATPLIAIADEIRRHHAPVDRVVEAIAPQLARDRDDAALQQRARELYAARSFDRASEFFEEIGDRRAARWARVMNLLHTSTAVDIRWADVRRTLADLRDSNEPEQPRVSALDSIAALLAKSTGTRFLDPLAAEAKSATTVEHARAVLFVLAHHLRVAQSKPPSEALSLVLPLPEQIFRVWARWRLDISYLAVPEGMAAAWRMTKSTWEADERDNRMRVPAPGEPFPSFRCFALFCQTAATLRGGGIEPSMRDFSVALRTLQLRNDSAHALARLDDSQKRSYLALIERWLDRLFDACPGGQSAALRREVDLLLTPPPM